MLINRSKVKEFALEMAKHRAHKFTRVGSELLHQVRRRTSRRLFVPRSTASPPKAKPSTEDRTNLVHICHVTGKACQLAHFIPQPVMPKRCDWLLHQSRLQPCNRSAPFIVDCVRLPDRD